MDGLRTEPLGSAPRDGYCCDYHKLVWHLVDPRDYYYRCFFNYDQCSGTQNGLPFYELYMLCQQLLFRSLDCLGLRQVISKALDHDEKYVELFYEFTDFRLNLKVIAALDRVIGEQLAKMHRGYRSDEFAASRLAELLDQKQLEKAVKNYDVVVWTAVKSVLSFFLDLFSQYHNMERRKVLRGWDYMVSMLTTAADLGIPKTDDGRLAMPIVETAALILIYKRQRDNTLLDSLRCDSDNVKLAGRISFQEEYSFHRFFMDKTADPALDPECSEVEAMASRIRKLVKEDGFLYLKVHAPIGRLTRLANGRPGDQVTDTQHIDCRWIEKFLNYRPMEQGEYFYAAPEWKARLDQYIEKAQTSFNRTMEREHALLLARNDIKKMISTVSQYNPDMPTIDLLQVHRLLDGLGFLVCDSRRLTDAAHLRRDLLRALAAVMKVAHRHKDWFTFALALLPFTLHHGPRSAVGVDIADKTTFFQQLLDCLACTDSFAVCTACSALAVFLGNEVYFKELMKMDILLKVILILKGPKSHDHELDDNVVAQLSLIILPLFACVNTGFASMVPLDDVCTYLKTVQVAAVPIILNKRNFNSLRFQLRHHEVSINGFLTPGESPIVTPKKLYVDRKGGQYRSRVLMSLFGTFVYMFNKTPIANKYFFNLDGVRLLHAGLKEKEKPIITASLKSLAQLLRGTSGPYRMTLMKFPGLIGDVSRIYSKYKLEAIEEPALDILCRLCAPYCGTLEQDVWTEWVQCDHTKTRLLPKLLRQAAMSKPLTIATYSMGVLVVMAKFAPEPLFEQLKRENIVVMCRNHLLVTPRQHGFLCTQEVMDHSLRVMANCLQRAPSLIDTVNITMFFENLLNLAGSPYPTNKQPFKMLNPCYFGDGDVLWMSRVKEPEKVTATHVDKKQRDEMMSSVVYLIKCIMSWNVKPICYYAARLIDCGFFECMERVLLKVNINLGHPLLKKNRLLENCDSHNQWSWFEALSYCKLFEEISIKDVPGVIVEKICRRPSILVCIHNLLLVMSEDGGPDFEWKDTKRLVDIIMLILSQAMEVNFGEQTTDLTRKQIRQILESQQSLFNNKWKDRTLLDTLFSLAEKTAHTSTYDSVMLFCDCVGICVAEHPEFVLPLKPTDAYQQMMKADKKIPAVSREMVECQMNYMRHKPDTCPWSKGTRYSDFSTHDEPIFLRFLDAKKSQVTHASVGNRSAGDGRGRLGDAYSAMEADAVWDLEVEKVQQECRQAAILRLPMEAIVELQEVGMPTLFDIPEMQLIVNAEREKRETPQALNQLLTLELELREERDRLVTETGDGTLTESVVQQILQKDAVGNPGSFVNLDAISKVLMSKEKFPMTRAAPISIPPKPPLVDPPLESDTVNATPEATTEPPSTVKTAEKKAAAGKEVSAGGKLAAQSKQSVQSKLVVQSKPVAQSKLVAQSKPVAQSKLSAQSKPVAQSSVNSALSPAKSSIEPNATSTTSLNAGSTRSPSPSSETSSNDDVKRCDHCQEPAPKAKKCARCKKARYCSRDCQRTAWNTHHRAVCTQDEAATDSA